MRRVFLRRFRKVYSENFGSFTEVGFEANLAWSKEVCEGKFPLIACWGVFLVFRL